MGLRKEFLVHKNKTVESFRFVRADISSINSSIENIKTMLLSLESRISAIDNEMPNLLKWIEKNTDDINAQQNNILSVQSKIDGVNKSITNGINTINSLNNGLNELLSKQRQIFKNISIHDKSIKKLFALSKNQSLKNKQLNSTLKKSQEEVKKLRNFINKRLKTITTKAIRKPYKRIVKKKTTPKRMVKKAKAPKKIVTETTKKTVTEVKK